MERLVKVSSQVEHPCDCNRSLIGASAACKALVLGYRRDNVFSLGRLRFDNCGLAFGLEGPIDVIHGGRFDRENQPRAGSALR
jgi:hypothetical protein